MQSCGRRSYVFEITEDSRRVQAVEDFSIQRALAIVRKMMNREAGDDGVEVAEIRKRIIEVVRNHRYTRIRRKLVLQFGEHDGREIDRDEPRVRACRLYEIEQASSATSEIENTRWIFRKTLEQGGFAFDPVRNGIGSP